MNFPLNVPEDIDKYFFNRKNDLKYVKGYLDMMSDDVAHQIMITGCRGVGKSFFIKKLLNDLPDNILSVNVDLSAIHGCEYGEISEEEVLKELLDGISTVLLNNPSTLQNIKDIIISKIRQIPLKSHDFLDIPLHEFKKHYFELRDFVMELPQLIADESDDVCGFVIVVGEIQNLKNLKSPGDFFWMLRGYSQSQYNVSYIFTGSLSFTSDLISMINGPEGAYGGRLIHINLKAFTKEETLNYIHEKTTVKFSDEGFDEFYKITNGMPVYINTFLNVLDSHTQYNEKLIRQTFKVEIDKINVVWLSVWDTFTDKEKIIITSLFENDEMGWDELIDIIPFSKSTILKHVDILNNRGVIDNYFNKYVISDKMLILWLKHKKEILGHYPV